ncbi:MAG: FAD-dependent oxidoreductase, partial [Alphaproteobacteria bacterium]|nr:FAD-dependent oxidoreductase [Alphaproteobacteria bacterium]
AEEEGVMIHWLRTIKQIDETRFTVEKMEIDEQGRPQPTGEFETIEADTLILALGQDVDTAFLDSVPGVNIGEGGMVMVDEQMMTGREGLFAGGDMVPAERTVTVAIGHGRKAANHIDAWLRGKRHKRPSRPELAGFGVLNTWYYDDAPKTVQPQLDLVRRQSDFAEVLQGLTEDNALYEARRCLSCGNCFECDNCYGVCPDNAVNKLGAGKRFDFNYDYCKGCGMCAAECPCAAIIMVPETV